MLAGRAGLTDGRSEKPKQAIAWHGLVNDGTSRRLQSRIVALGSGHVAASHCHHGETRPSYPGDHGRGGGNQQNRLSGSLRRAQVVVSPTQR